MTTNPICVSAPGSLMLLGEHAVLHGHSCLVAAIDRRVRISILPRNDGLATMTSALGHYEGDRDSLPDHPDFRFAVGALRALPDALPAGLDLLIDADMPPTIGFGTSAAVTVAILGALQTASGKALSPTAILANARAVIQQVQGRGSGADAAASALGGIVHYCMEGAPSVISRSPHPVTALYCGYKTATPDVIRRVEETWKDRPCELEQIYSRIGVTAEEGVTVLEDSSAFGAVLNKGHALMQQLGVGTPELESCAEMLRGLDGISGSKISGSGLGDCVIGWGRASSLPRTFESFNLCISAEGVRLE